MKPAKKRNKKHNVNKFLQFGFEKLVKDALETVYFVGDEFRKPFAFNCHHLRNSALKSSVREAEHEFLKRLLNEELQWRTIAIAFLEGEEEGTIDTVATEFTSKTTFIPFINYMEENLKPAINKAIEEDGCDKDKLITYAYVVMNMEGYFERYCEKITDMMFQIDLLGTAKERKDQGNTNAYSFKMKDFIEAIFNDDKEAAFIYLDEVKEDIERLSDYVPVGD